MLLRFRVTNFLSFNETEELTMVASKLRDKHQKVDLIPTHERIGVDVLPSAVLYGANGAGKSNLVDALQFMRQIVLSRGELEDYEPENLTPFALSTGKNAKNSDFEISFLKNDTRFDYGFSINSEGIKSEHAFSYPQGRKTRIFERRIDGSRVFGSLKLDRRSKNAAMSELIGKRRLLLNGLAELGVEIAQSIQAFFLRLNGNNQISVSSGDLSLRYQSREILPEVRDFLKNAGTGIIEIKRENKKVDDSFLEFQNNFRMAIEKSAGSAIANELEIQHEETFIEFGHKSNDGNVVYFPARWESSGTLRLVILGELVTHALRNGTPLIIDEFDASLHTAIGDAILSLFARKETNPHGAQLIVTTHDTNLLDSEYLRRDQIWFVEKDQGGASHLTPLSDFSVRADAAIAKGYLQGRFGAIPFAGSPERLFKPTTKE